MRSIIHYTWIEKSPREFDLMSLIFKKEAVFLDRTQSNSLPFIRRKEPLPLFRRRVMACSFTKRLQFASLSFSLAWPCLEKSKKKEEKLSNYFLVSIFSLFVFFSTRLALWCEVSEKSIATSPDVAHNFFLVHGYVYPRINGNSHKPSSPSVGHKYICAYFRSWSQFCGLATGCTTYPSGTTQRK